MIVPTRTVNCDLHVRQRHRWRALRSPVALLMRYDSPTTPHLGHTAPASAFQPRCRSKNATAAPSSSHALGSFASISDFVEPGVRCLPILRSRLRLVSYYYPTNVASGITLVETKMRFLLVLALLITP